MTCQDCRYYNPKAEHKCDKYPAVFPIEDVEICGSFKPKANLDKKVDSSWDEVSK